MKIPRVSLVLAVLLAALPIAALAQFETATVLGTVKDGTGAVIIAAVILDQYRQRQTDLLQIKVHPRKDKQTARKHITFYRSRKL